MGSNTEKFEAALYKRLAEEHSSHALGTYVFDFYACAQLMQRSNCEYKFEKDEGCLCVTEMWRSVGARAMRIPGVKTLEQYRKWCINGFVNVPTATATADTISTYEADKRKRAGEYWAQYEKQKTELKESCADKWVDSHFPSGKVATALMTSEYALPICVYEAARDAGGFVRARVYEEVKSVIMQYDYSKNKSTQSRVDDRAKDKIQFQNSVFEASGHFNYVHDFTRDVHRMRSKTDDGCQNINKEVVSLNVFQSMAMWMLWDTAGDTDHTRDYAFYQRVKTCWEKFTARSYLTGWWPTRIMSLELLQIHMQLLANDCAYTKKIVVCLPKWHGVPWFTVNSISKEYGFTCHVYEGRCAWDDSGPWIDVLVGVICAHLHIGTHAEPFDAKSHTLVTTHADLNTSMHTPFNYTDNLFTFAGIVFGLHVVDMGPTAVCTCISDILWMNSDGKTDKCAVTAKIRATMYEACKETIFEEGVDTEDTVYEAFEAGMTALSPKRTLPNLPALVSAGGYGVPPTMFCRMCVAVPGATRLDRIHIYSDFGGCTTAFHECYSWLHKHKQKCVETRVDDRGKNLQLMLRRSRNALVNHSDMAVVVYRHRWHYAQIICVQPHIEVGSSTTCMCGNADVHSIIRGTSLYQGIAFLILHGMHIIPVRYERMTTQDYKKLQYVRRELHRCKSDVPVHGWATRCSDEWKDPEPTTVTHVITELLRICKCRARIEVYLHTGRKTEKVSVGIDDAPLIGTCCGHVSTQHYNGEPIFYGTIVPDASAFKKVQTRPPPRTLQTRVVDVVRKQLMSMIAIKPKTP